MASYPAPNNRRRRNRQQPPSPLRTASTVAVAAVAAYGTYRLASWAWNWYADDDDSEEDREKHDTSCVENPSELDRDLHGGLYRNAASDDPKKRHLRRLARQHRIRRCREETISALTDFLPTLKDTVESATDFAAETAELKRIRSARAARMKRRTEREADVAADGGSDNDMERDDKNVPDALPKNKGGKEEQEEEEEEEADLIEERNERRRETELWETIKVKSVTRLVATAYGHSILLLVLTVQVHLLGGRLFREEEAEEEAAARTNTSMEDHQQEGAKDEIEVAADAFSTASSLGLMSRTGPGGGGSVNNNSTSSAASYQSTHRAVLTKTYGHLFSTGISSLIRTVEHAVFSAFECHDVTDPDSMNITAEQFNAAIDAVRAAVEGKERGGSRSGRAALVRYVIQAGGGGIDGPATDVIGIGASSGIGEKEQAAAVGDPVAVHILEETWDVLESPPFEAAERDVLDLTFGMMREGGWGGIFPPVAGVTDVAASSAAGGSGTAPPTRPLAQVVTQLRRTVCTFFSSVGADGRAGAPLEYRQRLPNMYLLALDRLPTVVELGDVGFN